jgi:hypothetical protein
MITFTIKGVVKVAETLSPIPHLFVKAYDKDLIYDDLLGNTYTDKEGQFTIINEVSDFRELFDTRPDIYFKFYTASGGKQIFSTESKVSFNAAINEFFEILIPAKYVQDVVPPATITLSDEKGASKNSFEAGESLRVNLQGLQRKTVYDIQIKNEQGESLFTTSLITDASGSIDTIIWPQMGLEDITSDKRYTYEEARQWLADKKFFIVVDQRNKNIFRKEIKTTAGFSTPVLYNAEPNGRILNGFEIGQGAARLSVHNAPFKGNARVYLVKRQHNWNTGDRFEPVELSGGRLAFADALIDASGTLHVEVARPEELQPGAYDYIVRSLRYGYEDDEELLIRENDLATKRLTGITVREQFMPSKTVLGGCVNTMPISGRTISGAPYYQYSNVFQQGENIYGALDPVALDPGLIGKMVALYVIQHKPSSDWASDNSLNHLAELGGNAAVQKFKTQSSCINMNEKLIWPSANTLGRYDIVADFGNNTGNAGSFVNDNYFNPPIDIIDGYFLEGFHVVQDPGIIAPFNFAGSFEYNDGSFTVADEGTNRILDKKGVVFFPADFSGATAAGQISGAQASYPLVVVVHGNSSFTNSYQGYNYVLEHLARNGFIVASIHMLPGMDIYGRCEVTLAHIDALKSKFGIKAANNIGLMGHSRGGEAVYIVPRLNHDRALGHNINAVISLAPTNFHPTESLSGVWACPLQVVYGSLDGDVGFVDFNGFQLYDRASGAKKNMVFVYGACHDRFNTVWGDTDFTFGELTAGDIARVITADAHQKIAKGYFNAFYRMMLKNEAQWEGVMKGDWIPAVVKTADAGHVKLYMQYSDTTNRQVDNFEGPHSATSWQTSTIGGNVTDSGTLPVTPSENNLPTLDVQSPHETAGLLFRWDNTADTLKYDIPPASRNVTAFSALSFRISQKSGSAFNPANMAQDLRVKLTDSANNARSIRVSKFREIPFPDVRGIFSFTKSAMCTVRVPLSSYIIQVINTQKVDLSNVTGITFEFLEKPAGEIEIDSIEFTL